MSAAKADDTCDVCEALLDMFRGLRTDKIDISSFRSPGSLQCSKHVPLVRKFEEHCQPRSSEAAPRPKEDMGFCRGRSVGEVTMTESVESLGICWELLLCPSGGDAENFEKGDILDPDWVDLDKIKRWKAGCLKSHGSQCQDPMRIWTTTPAWLVDVELECVVPGGTNKEFIALSYTYGNHLGLNVDAELNTRLREPYAFRQEDIVSRLPPILQHAMFITQTVGERYLWMDAMCIVHSNPAETSSQLSMMGSIYASAVMTIVAGDGDAEEGISGLEGISKSRAAQQTIIPFGDRKIIVRKSGIFSLAHGRGPYFSRAWTYQEHKMAKRKLFFLDKQAHWECQHKQFHEEVAPDAEVNTYIDPRMVESLSGFLELGSFNNIIGTYNELELRYAEDALPGITGLLSVLSRSFEGGFLFGIPEMFFHRALAWGPYWAHTELERRTRSDRPKQVQLPPGHLPSWSWIGWKGLVNLGNEASRINDRQSRIEETFPMVDWFAAMSPTAGPSERRRIHSKWYENRDAWKSGEKQLPGWTKVEFDSDEGTFRGEPRLFPAGCEGRVYRHQDMPKTKDYGPTDDWYFPFPVRKVSGAMTPDMPEQTPYLFSRTRRAVVLGRRTTDITDDTVEDSSKIIALCNSSDGRTIGTLHLHAGAQLEQFPLAQNPSPLGHEQLRFHAGSKQASDEGLNTASVTDSIGSDPSRIEIVAVSVTRIYSKTWNEGASRYEKPFKSTEKVNVLWVEWEEGIAYRKAGGVVRKEEWEQLALEDIDLVLG